MAGKVLHEENSRTVLTINAPIEQDGNKIPQYIAAGVGTLGALAAGTFLSWSSPALPLLNSPHSHIKITSEEESWVGSLITLGAILGAIPAGIIANCIGRKRLLQCLCLPMLAAWLLIGFSSTVIELYISRFVAGICVGAISVATPMYVSELAEPSVRGALGTLFQLQITLGVLFGYVAGLVQNFQVLAFICATIPVLFFISFAFIPESPVYLTSKNKHKEAKEALQWFRGNSYDIQEEIEKIGINIRDAANSQASISDIFNSKATSKAFIISLGLMVFQQMSGINAVIFYTGNIFQAAGTTISPSLCAIIIGSVLVISTYASTLLIDRAGRRILLTISDSVMVICLCILAVYFYFMDSVDMSMFSWVPLLSVALFIIVFSIGFGPIPWLMLGEIFPENIKGPASSIAASFNWLLAFTVTKFFQNLTDIIGISFTFGFFAVICLFGTFFVRFIVPETKGKDMEEIQMELEGKNCENRMFLSVEKGTKVFFSS